MPLDHTGAERAATMTPTDIRLAMHRNGFPPVPIVTGQKYPKAEGWTVFCSGARPDDIRRWATSLPDHGSTGILCGHVLGVDIDVIDPNLAAEIELLARKMLGVSPLRRVGRKGAMLPYRTSSGVMDKQTSGAFHLPDGSKVEVEILGYGQQFVAFGDHPDTGRPYTWDDRTPADTKLDELPAVELEQARAFLAACADRFRALSGQAIERAKQTRKAESHKNAADLSPPSTDALVKLVAAMPHPLELCYDDYVSIMLAIVGCQHGLAATGRLAELDDERIRDAAVDWALRWEGYKGTDELAKWQDDWSKRDRVLAGWNSLLVHAARLGVDVTEARYDTACAEFGPLPELPPDDNAAASPRERARSKLRLLTPAESADAPLGKYIVKGLIAEHDVGCVFGPPGAGKSVLGPHIGYCVARGVPTFGRRTRAGTVFYVPAEDAHGMRRRVTALRLTHGDADNFRTVEGVSNLLDGAEAGALRQLVEEHTPSLIVIDTLAMAFPGIDENTAQDMGRVVDVARSLTRWGAAVLLVHHDTKARDGTPRGHSLLHGALDMALRLDPADTNGIIRGSLVKNRNGGCHETLAFRIPAAGVSVGTDEDGDPVTAPIAIEVTAAAAAGPKLTALQGRVLGVLRDMIEDGGFVSEDEWRDECDARRVSTSESAKTRREAFNGAFRALLDVKQVVARGHMVWLPGAGDEFAVEAESAESRRNPLIPPRQSGGAAAEKAESPFRDSAFPPPPMPNGKGSQRLPKMHPLAASSLPAHYVHPKLDPTSPSYDPEIAGLI